MGDADWSLLKSDKEPQNLLGMVNILTLKKYRSFWVHRINPKEMNSVSFWK